MNKYFSLIGILFLSGCVSFNGESVSPQSVLLRQNSLTNISALKAGMSYPEVTAIMGPFVKIGYKKSDYQTNGFEPITLRHPYRVETLSAQDKAYEVTYYFTVINNADGIIADDELTPLVFEDQKLIGKGWDFLFQLRKNIKLM